MAEEAEATPGLNLGGDTPEEDVPEGGAPETGNEAPQGDEPQSYVPWQGNNLAEHFPEGYEIQEFESNLLLDFINKHELNADQAKAYLEAHQTYQTQLDSAIENSEKELSDKWWNETKNDPVVGGNNWQKTERQVIGLLDRFADQDFRDFLMAAGGNVNLSVIRFLNKVAEKVPTEGSGTNGADQPRGRSEPLSQAARLFGGNS